MPGLFLVLLLLQNNICVTTNSKAGISVVWMTAVDSARKKRQWIQQKETSLFFCTHPDFDLCLSNQFSHGSEFLRRHLIRFTRGISDVGHFNNRSGSMRAQFDLQCWPPLSGRWCSEGRNSPYVIPTFHPFEEWMTSKNKDALTLETHTVWGKTGHDSSARWRGGVKDADWLTFWTAGRGDWRRWQMRVQERLYDFTPAPSHDRRIPPSFVQLPLRYQLDLSATPGVINSAAPPKSAISHVTHLVLTSLTPILHLPSRHLPDSPSPPLHAASICPCLTEIHFSLCQVCRFTLRTKK